MAPQVKDFEEFLAQAMTSSSTTSISASPSLASSSLYSNNSPSSSSDPSPSPSPSPSPTNDQDLDQLEQQHRNDDSFYDNLSFDTPPPQATPSSRSHAIYLNPHSQELSPMQLVTLSNLKLNNEVFSNRSLSIQKRILVKNLLTMLYTLHPPHPQEWHYQIETEEQQEEEQGQPDKTNNGQWTTLDAAGLHAGERSSSLQGVPPSPSLTPSQPSRNNPFLNINSNTSSSEPGSPTATKVSLPRPKSTDLPQSLHSYLSTVFDVDWSVGLSTTEDSLFTLHSAGSSSSILGSSSSMSGPGGAPLSSSPKRKSLSASSSLSLSLSLSDFTTPSGSSNSTHVGNTNGGVSSSTASATPSSSSFSTSSSSTVSSISSASVGNGASSTPLSRKSSLSSSQPKNINNTNRPPTNSANSNSSNSTGGGETVVKKQSVASKPVMVPGRRSSLLQTGQMPTAVNTPSSSGSLSPGIGRNNSYTTPKSPTLSGSRSPTLSPYSHAPSSPSLSPTLSPTSSGSFSFGSGVAPPSPSLSPTLSPTLGSKPAISRRTSSLPTERPRQNQRLPSSENGTPTLSSTSPAGLPRPLQTSTMSSLSSSPPSPSTLAPSKPKHLQAPYPYSRSVSDEHINFSSYQQQQYTRHGASSSPPSLSHPPLPPISSSYSGVSVAASSSTSLAKPLPSYTLNKASKSSPNLGDGANDSNYYGDNHPALPTSLDMQYQQQFQQQFFQKSPPPSPSTTGASGEQHRSSTSSSTSSTSISSGFNKLLSRTSSRRGAVGNTTPESYAAGQSEATSTGAAMTISAPLSLISSVDQEGFQSHHRNNHQYQYQSHPQAYKAQDSLSSSPRSYGHGYSQSVGGHSFGNTGQGSQPSSTTASASSGGGGGGGGNRWSSMKTMLGLRVGQTKG
ncbi:hypothetical protein BG006_002560 [Podila minutissima]|uniref:Uncharacterized protein n=1 Tax=Podila minutissima TaxID=64525 RepID=A0A9P5VGP1_9FUNG|nr:hypothetical protein BG006_002560 [Podila minutissima]